MRILAALGIVVLAGLPLGAEEEPGLPLPVALREEGGLRRSRPRIAVAYPLEWLAAHQRDDGSWGAADWDSWQWGILIWRPRPLPGAGEPDRDGVVTSLALGAYLGAGYTHRGNDRYARVVARGLRWLKVHQVESGHFATPGAEGETRTHAVATLAMTEALGLTESPILRDSARAGLERLMALQAPDGSWHHDGRPDVLATTWAFMALLSAHLIQEHVAQQDDPPLLGLDLTQAFHGLEAWLERHTEAGTGRVVIEGEAHPLLATAMGALIRIHRGEDPRTSVAIQGAARVLEAHPPTWLAGDPAADLAYIHLGTLVMRQVGGPGWKVWNDALWDAVARTERRDGRVEDLRGSWDPRGRLCEPLGRVGASALASLSLHVYYRYDRTFGAHGGTRPRLDLQAPAAERGTWARSVLPPHAMRFRDDDGRWLPVPALAIAAEIDGPRARVVLDFWVENPTADPCQGHLELRLPDDAAPCYLAFGESAIARPAPFAAATALRTDLASLRSRQEGDWGSMREARMAPTERARRAYESIVRRRKDPALLTWNGAGVFDLGVFPLLPRTLHRVVLAYEVDLTPVGGDLELRLDVPEGVGDVQVAVSVGDDRLMDSVQSRPQARREEGWLRWEAPAPGPLRVLVPDPGTVALVGEDDAGDTYFAAWIRPLEEPEAVAAPSRALFLVDTSGGTESTRLAMRRELLEQLLAGNRPALEAFALATFDTDVSWWRPGFVENTPEHAAAAVEHVLSVEPAGATDLERALVAARALEGDHDVILLSDGVPTWGERDATRLAAAHDPAHRLFAYRTALGGETSLVLEALAARSRGAVFAVLGARDVAAAARAHRHPVRRIVGLELPGVEDLFVAGDVRTVQADRRLLLVGRGSPEPGAPLVMRLASEGDVEVLRLPLPTPRTSTMAPRAYGQAAVALLEGDGNPGMAWAYAAHFRVVREAASLVMLESERDYDRFGIEIPDTRAAMRAAPVRRLRRREAVAAPAAEARWGWAYLAERLKALPTTFQLPPELVSALGSLEPARLELSATLDGPAVDLEADGVARWLEQDPGDAAAALAAATVAWDAGRPDLAYRDLVAGWPEGRFDRLRFWMLARLAEALDRPALALLWYEVALGREAAQDGAAARIVAHDYRRFLGRHLAGLQDADLSAFGHARARSLEPLSLVGEAACVVLLAASEDGVELGLLGEDGRFRLAGAEPPDEDAWFVSTDAGSPGVRMLVVERGACPLSKLRVIGRARAWRAWEEEAPPVQVLVTVVEDWGREGERIRHRRFVVRTGSAILPIDGE